MNESTPPNESFWLRVIGVLSVVLSAAVAFLILGPRPEGMEGALDVSMLPFVNATLNSITGVLLIVGFLFVRAKRIEWHKKTMLTAFGTSAAFLVTYVIYHWFNAGPKRYEGDLTTLYYGILISHIVLAVAIIPLALLTLYRGWNRQDEKHRKLAKVTLPIWLYVSVTGVVIYAMLY